MSIISSVIAADDAQSDGRRWILENHTDNLGVIYLVSYLANNGFDAAAALTARIATLEASIIFGEITTNVANVKSDGSLAVITFLYSTAGQNIAALRAAYLQSTKQEAIMIGDFLSSLTDTQLKNIFNMTATQVTTLRANKLTPAATIATSIRAAVGA